MERAFEDIPARPLFHGVYTEAVLPEPLLPGPPVEDGGDGAADEVPSDPLVTVDEQPCVCLRRSPLPANVEWTNALTSIKVVSLRSSLAVSTNKRIEGCSSEVGSSASEVKESSL